MKWERPAFVAIAMNAEIGGYQSDFDEELPARPRGPVLGAEPSQAASAAGGDEQASAAPAS